MKKARANEGRKNYMPSELGAETEQIQNYNGLNRFEALKFVEST